MAEPFTLSVPYGGEERTFTAQLLLQGYTHKFKIIIDKTEVIFEPDEEGEYRAIRMPWQQPKDLDNLDQQLLHAIQQKIASIRE